MEKEVTTYYSLLIAQDLGQDNYQIIIKIIYMKDFIELNVNKNMTIRNVQHAKWNISIATVFSSIQALKMI